MQSTIRHGLLALAALLPAAAHAADTGPYVDVEAGASFVPRFSLHGDDLGQTLRDSPDTEPVIGAGVGYKFSALWRADLSLSYRPEAGFSATDQADQLGVKSRVSSLRGFVTGYADIPGLLTDGALGAFNPYVGLGLGFARNSLHDITLTDLTAPSSANRFTLTGATHTGIAWQAVGGVGYNLTDAVMVDARYRYVDAGRVKSGTTLSSAGVQPTGANIISGRLTTHELVLGIRYRF